MKGNSIPMRRQPVATRATRRLTKGHFSASEGVLVSSHDGACAGLRDAVIGQWEVFLKAAITTIRVRLLHRTVDDLLEAAGEIQVVIGRTFAFQDASNAHDYAETGRPLGRVIMTP